MSLPQILQSGRDTKPDSAALRHRAITLDYARLAGDTDRIAARLAGCGIGPGSIVATDIRKPVSHWVVLLALMRLGAVSVSLTSNAAREIGALAGLSAVVSGPDAGRALPDGVQQIHIAAGWLGGPPPDAGALPGPAEAADSAGRICFTSGTTGRPKAILLDTGRLSARLAGTAARTGLDGNSVLWCGLGPDTAYGFTATLAAWLAGGTVVLSGGGPGSWRQMHGCGVNLLLSSPAALRPLIRDAAPQKQVLSQAAAIVAGGRLSAALRDEVLAHLCPRVQIAFGSSEAGGITLGDAAGLDGNPGHAGRIFADVEAGIVDDAGRLQPPGTPGRLRVRTGSLVPGYINDPAASARCFQDGWFLSGDLARIAADGTLTVLGRPASILNLGGVKIPAEDLETALRDHAGVEDACALLLSAGGEAELAIAVATAPGTQADLGARIRSLLPGVPEFRLMTVREIPRGSMGKIDRQAFAATIRAAIAGGQSGITVLGRF